MRRCDLYCTMVRRMFVQNFCFFVCFATIYARTHFWKLFSSVSYWSCLRRFKWQMFVPALLLGVAMYFIKAFHLGNPAVALPAVLLLPLVVFYAVVPAGACREACGEGKML